MGIPQRYLKLLGAIVGGMCVDLYTGGSDLSISTSVFKNIMKIKYVSYPKIMEF